MNHDIKIAERLLFFRKEYIGNGRDMAELCNVSPKTISHVERGLAKINTEILQALVRKKNLNVNWLLTGKGHPIAGAAERRIDAVDVRGSVEIGRASCRERVGQDV